MWSMPVALSAVGAMAVAPVLASAPLPGSLPTPTALAAELGERTVHAATVLTSSVGELGSAIGGDLAAGLHAAEITAVGLLGHAPAAELGRFSAHQLASFVALPAATTPLRTAADHDGAAASAPSASAAFAPSATASVAPVAQPRALLATSAASSSLGDLLGALSGDFNTILQAANGAPQKIIQSIGQLLQGDVDGGLTTLTNIVIEPLLQLGISVSAITDPLAKLLPPLAPVINEIPGVVISVGISGISAFFNFRSGLVSTIDGVRDALAAGNVGGALTSLVSGTLGIIKQGNSDLFGGSGSVLSSLLKAGQTLLGAIAKVPGATLGSLTSLGSSTSLVSGASVAGAKVGLKSASSADQKASQKADAQAAKDAKAQAKADAQAAKAQAKADAQAAKAQAKADAKAAKEAKAEAAKEAKAAKAAEKAQAKADAKAAKEAKAQAAKEAKAEKAQKAKDAKSEKAAK